MQRSVSALSSRTWSTASFGVSRRPAVRTMASKADTVRQTVSDNKVVVYSKTHCPYCTRVKGLMGELKVPATVIELDQMADGGEYQDTLQEMVGRRSVPQVFIGGNHVGGCDDTLAAYDSGKLKDMLATVGFSI
ncbi:MAG: thioredoxin-like protein [Monoraphidium minutum]|nr:MAG: thioredoxin-like protein [Monoraphidium minutum]